MAAGICRTFTERAPSDAVWVGSGFNNLPVKALGGEIRYPKKGTPQVVRTLDTGGNWSPPGPGADGLACDPDVQSLWETTSRVKAAIGEQTIIGQQFPVNPSLLTPSGCRSCLDPCLSRVTCSHDR